MRLQILSDLHLEFPRNRERFRFQRANDIDALVLAGDIHAHLGIFTLKEELSEFDGVPIYYVPGNHEYYGTDLPSAVSERMTYQAIAAHDFPNLYILDDSTHFHPKATVIGATLWTDTLDDWFATQTLRKGMPDYAGAIHNGLGQHFEPRFLHPSDTDQLHRRSKHYLDFQLKGDTNTPAVIITHHLPHPSCVNPRFKCSPLNVGFVSDQSELLYLHQHVRLWVHGHTHDSVDVMVHNTRIVCNPRGYPNAINPNFDPLFTVTI